MKSNPLLNETITRLKKIALFKDICNNEEAMASVAELFAIEKFDQGKTVIAEGEFGNKLYIIKEGTVEIVKKTLQNNDNYTVTELSAAMNIFFGEIGLLDSDRRSATVICKTDAEFYVLTHEKFLQLGDTHPQIGLSLTRELSKILCSRLRKANADIITLFGALVEELAQSGGLDI